MKLGLKILFALLVLCRSARAQGFINLDFESANTDGYAVGGQIQATDAFPGWTVSAGYILYDDVSLSGGSVSIIDTNPAAYWESYPTIQGKYFALLTGFNYAGNQYAVSIGQTGTIEASVQSLVFWGYVSPGDVSFNGQALQFFLINSTPNYNVYWADISAFAGQTGQLLFSSYGSDRVDNIQFSTTAVPEPDMLALFVLGGLCLLWRGRQLFGKS